MAAECQKCGSANEDGAVFCSMCGARIAVMGDSEEPYVVWRDVPGAYLTTKSQTRSQYFTGLALITAFIGFLCVISVLILGMAGLCIAAPVAVVLVVAQYVYWIWGRDEAEKKP